MSSANELFMQSDLSVSNVCMRPEFIDDLPQLLRACVARLGLEQSIIEDALTNGQHASDYIN